MKFEVNIYDPAQASDKKKHRMVAKCGDLRDACIAALAFLPHLKSTNEGSVHIWVCKVKPLSGQQHLGCWGNWKKADVEAFVAECKTQLGKEIDLAKAAMEESSLRRAFVDQRWPEYAAWSALHDDSTFTKALYSGDFAAAEQRAVELGYPPKQKEVA